MRIKHFKATMYSTLLVIGIGMVIYPIDLSKKEETSDGTFSINVFSFGVSVGVGVGVNIGVGVGVAGAGIGGTSGKKKPEFSVSDIEFFAFAIF